MAWPQKNSSGVWAFKAVSPARLNSTLSHPAYLRPYQPFASDGMFAEWYRSQAGVARTASDANSDTTNAR